MTESCANCGAPLTDLHCGACGQERVGRLSFRDLAAAGLAEIASLDTAFLRTFLGLCRRPGRVAREYVEGRRIQYLNPLKYALFSVTVYVVLTHLFGSEIGLPRQQSEEGVRFDTILSFLPYLMILSLLPTAALQSLLFRSRGDRVAECYVFGLFAYSHVFWLLTPLVLAGLYGQPYGFFAVHGLRLGFWIWATAGFYRSSSPGALLKAGAVFLIFFFVTTVLAGVTGQWLGWWNRQ